MLGLFPAEISSRIAPVASFRGNQIFRWLHLQGVKSFSEMSNLPAALRDRLQTEAPPYTSLVDTISPSEDGTIKLRLKLSDGLMVESVLLSDAAGRITACLSTQVGCAMGCSFCKTATMGLVRNLTAAEIVEQLYRLEELPEAAGRIDSVVFMGMGEPLNNYEAFSRSVRLLTHPEGRGMSPRRLTVSTSGIVEGIDRLATDSPQMRLAVSIVAADPALRLALMPVERRNPLSRLKQSLMSYQKSGGRRVTLEYVLLRGINDRTSDPELVAQFARGLNCNINLIPWNPATGIGPVILPDGRSVELAEPDNDTVQRFSRALEKRGLTVVVRYRKGRGVNAACGQLATENSAFTAD